MSESVHSLMLVGSYGVFRESLATVLSQIPRYEVTDQAERLNQAWELYRRRPAEALLMDLDGSDSGLAGELKEFKEEFPRAAIIALGCTQAYEQVVELVRVGIAGYLERDSSLDELGRTIDLVLSGGVACSPGVVHRMFTGLAELDRRRRRAARIEALELTHRELQILRLISEGLSNKEIASQLFLSVSTVKNHVHHILRKLRVQHRWDAAAKARGELWFGDQWPRGRRSPRGRRAPRA